MKAISLWQPYASLIMAGRKKFETRSWAFPATMKGEVIMLHAAKRPIPKDGYGYWVDQISTNTFGADYRKTLPFGAYVGMVRLVECHETDVIGDNAERVHMVEYAVGNWDSGRYAWELDSITPLDPPVPQKGKQGWWTVEPDFRLVGTAYDTI